MTLTVYGINHISAPVDIREQVSFSADMMTDALRELKCQEGIREAAILSTCNRTDIYCHTEEAAQDKPIVWLHHFHGIKQGLLRPFLYHHPDRQAVRHILRVASGLDSMVFGEPQILGQLKKAYRKAIYAGSVGHQLNRLFQHSFHAAKEVRGHTSIGNHPVSVAYTAVRLAQQIFGDLKNRTALLIGAGETVELAVKHLHDNGLKRMIIANRTLHRSLHLANQYSVYAIKLSDIAKHLAEADIIIASTASRLPILDKETVANAIKTRKHKPMFMVDIAVPRDIEIAVGEINDVYLYNIDDLKKITQDNLRNRHQAAKQAEKIIDLQIQKYMDWLNSLNATSTICALREKVQIIQQEALKSGLIKLDNGADPKIVLQETLRIFRKKLLHTPSTQLRNASANNRDDLLIAAEELYGLSRQSTSPDRK